MVCRMWENVRTFDFSFAYDHLPPNLCLFEVAESLLYSQIRGWHLLHRDK